MKNEFAGLIEYSEEEFKKIWSEALFVIDTNVLMNFYKYTSKGSYDSLLSVLKNLKELDRLWIPHQVALEYFFNYKNSESNPDKAYKELVTELLNLLNDEVNKIFSRYESEYKYFSTDAFKLIFKELKDQGEVLLREELGKSTDSLTDTNLIEKDLLGLLDGIIGHSYDQEKIDEIELIGKKRYADKTPPGFKDVGSKEAEGYRIYGNLKYELIYGDLILWNQMIDKAKNEDVKSVIFITEEKKIDWWQKSKNGSEIKGPQPHLIKEFLNETNKQFYMYRTDKFIRYSKDYLNELNVTDEEVENFTKDIKNIRLHEIENEKVLLEEKIVSKSAENMDFLSEKMINIPLKKFREFLTQDEWQYFSQLIVDSYLRSQSESERIFLYNQAIKWAAEQAVPNIENKFSKKLIEIVSIDQKVVNNLKYELSEKNINNLNSIEKFSFYSDKLDIINAKLIEHTLGF